MLIYIGTPMVAASLWKRSDIDRIEASLYRKVLRIGNMVSNRAILNTMTNIRLAGEVINYLSKEAWEQFRRQNRVTAFFIQKEENERTNSAVGRQPSDKEPLPRREKIYVPTIMLNMMLATTSNSTSVHYGMDHMCHKHKRLFTLDHIETCDQLTGC
jgi:sortase (surface protein transpeptidase)